MTKKIKNNPSDQFIKTKPYFQEDEFRLYLGDAVSLLKQLPDNSIDMVFADPPYFLSNGGFSVHAGKRVSVHKGTWDKSNGVDDDLQFHLNWIGEVRRILKPNGTLWVSGTYHSIYQCGYAMQKLGYHILNDVAWFKPNASPNLSCRFFTASHETIIWARKDKKGKHHFEYKLMKEGDWKEDSLKKPGLQMRSVWSILPPRKSEKTFGKHPTQKPVELLRRILLASTKKGDTVLDPFAGSSTTGIACEMIGNRNFIGIDTEKEYLELSTNRLKEFKKNNSKDLSNNNDYE
jgi:site-specific DNA-methyltransferase (adenine-specific)